MSNDPMTDEQRAQLEALSSKTGEELSGRMTRAQADAKINELRTGGELSASDQDTGVGPIDGDEAMDHDAEFSHTPISPNANR